ncbi:CPBP family intramembrane glutamic endopeptidase [Nocardiopsis mangrovi]|uniref:CPBP family intramembrane glutamic endopeptidase n=1 Tax=Nocardiopsis mangrovi TaxID=1179818 RepID=A0ABV9DSL8_9ACTN
MGTNQNHPTSMPTMRSPTDSSDTPLFFTHLRLGWRRAIAVIVALMAVFFALQFLPGLIVAGVLAANGATQLGDDPARLVGHPLMIMAANISLGLMIPATLLIMAWMGGVPWRRVLAVGRRFSWRRLLTTTATAFPVFALGIWVTALLLPGSYGAFALTGATAVMLAVIVFTLPLAAAAEEIVFRGGIGPAVGSGAGGEKLAATVGLLVSTMVFTVVHFSADPWLVLYQLWIGLTAGLLAIITRGLEASIALHVAHNVVLFAASTLFASDGLVIDRSATGDATNMTVTLTLIPCHIAVLAIAYLMERRRRADRPLLPARAQPDDHAR